jgi:hypothetical protein
MARFRQTLAENMASCTPRVTDAVADGDDCSAPAR